MKRDNWFNNIFFPEEIKKQKEKYNDSRKIIGFSHEILQSILLCFYGPAAGPHPRPGRLCRGGV